MLNLSLILEALNIQNQLKFIPISREETLKLIDDYGFTILDGVKINKDNIPDFYTTNHYKIMIGDVFAGIIGFNNYYDTWKGDPEMEFENGHGKHSLWVQMLEILPSARNFIGSPLAIIKGVFDYLIDYCKKNSFKSILCGAKTDRIANLYKRIGFKGEDIQYLFYFIK